MKYMFLDQAKTILDASELSQEERDLWAQALVHYGEGAAEKFVTNIGDDAKLLRIATEFLRARMHAGEELVQGKVTRAEGELLLDIVAQEKAAQATNNE